MVRWVSWACVVVMATGCFSSVEDGGQVGPKGGVLVLGQVTVVVPPGALENPRPFVATKVELALESYRLTGPAWRMAPEGQAFSLPVQLKLPLAAGASPERLFVLTAASAAGPWQVLPAAIEDGFAVVSVSHFSIFVPAESLSADAGILPDGGFADPLLDAGLTDAGLTDAGLTDAGLTHGGLIDAGVTDGGVDAGWPSCAGSAERCLNTFFPIYSYQAPSPGCHLQGRCIPSSVPNDDRIVDCDDSGNCTCMAAGVVTHRFSAPPEICDSPEGLQSHWSCTCGWGAVPVLSCAAPQPGQTTNLPVGATCPGGQMGAESCESGVCMNTSRGYVCGAECFASCPCGWDCYQGLGPHYCMPR